jgi:hypothetical protein
MIKFRHWTPLIREAPMARKKTLCRASNGLFVRNLGWKRMPSGYAQHKFYLGREESKATLASLRLEQLWDQVSRRWERENQTDLHATDRPVWDGVTFAIAEAVRNGDAVARIPLPLPFSTMIPESPLIGDWLDRLQSDITVIKIELHDEEADKHSEEQIKKQGERLIDMGRRMLHKPCGGETLHAALTAYSRWIRSQNVGVDKKVTAWGGIQLRHVEFIRSHLPDCSLDEIGTQRVEALLDILRLRPNGEKGKPVSVSWTRSCIKQFRHFLRWLNKTPEFAWKRPADLELTQVRIPLSAQEKSALARTAQVQTYTIDELRTLWEYATPFQRLFMLLALNCGFGRAEVASLESAEVFLHQKHPQEREVGCQNTAQDSWVFRVRHKTAVYGEWKLWPETVTAVEWWLRQRVAISVAPNVSTLLVNRNGQRYDTPTQGNHANFQIPNSWFRLSEVIRKDFPDFRRLSFNKLRKTAGNLIRSVAGGEVAAVFLCHGTPVKSDELLDLYTNRPFTKVFEAVDRVGAILRPLWSVVTEPFPEKPKMGGPNIGLGTIRRIQTMKQQGYKTEYIAENLEVSTETVRRWAKRLTNCEESKPNDIGQPGGQSDHSGELEA